MPRIEIDSSWLRREGNDNILSEYVKMILIESMCPRCKVQLDVHDYVDISWAGDLDCPKCGDTYSIAHDGDLGI
jgi:uncharacterized protein (UPF0212 family)